MGMFLNRRKGSKISDFRVAQCMDAHGSQFIIIVNIGNENGTGSQLITR